MEMEALRDVLNRMIQSEAYTYNEILEVSRELDVLIVREYSRLLNDDKQ